MKKLLAVIFFAIMAFAMCSAGVSAEEAGGSLQESMGHGNLIDLDDYLWDTEHASSDEEAVKYELRNRSIITALQPLFDSDSYSNYYSVANTMKKQGTHESIEAAIVARKSMIQLKSVADNAWFIWEKDNMPSFEGHVPTPEEQDKASLIGYGYSTIVLKYLLDDPSTAKGNIIACSGGMFLGRSNGSEGFPAAEVFNDMGYNYFLVERRVKPYDMMDSYMDFSRTIRYVRYAVAQEGWGGQDMIAGIGWSGGGGTMYGAINYFYGDIQYTDYDPDYLPDEIDQMPADLDVALAIYALPCYKNPENKQFGFEQGDYLLEDNPNLPAFFFCKGTADTEVSTELLQNLYLSLKDKVPAQLVLIEGAPHGYGVGTDLAAGSEIEECHTWPYEADAFIGEIQAMSDF